MFGRRSLDQIPAVLWTTDVDLRFELAAGAELVAVELDPADVRGATLSDVFGVQADLAAISAHRRALAGEVIAFELDWHGRKLNAVVQPLREAGETVGVIGLAVDEVGHPSAFRASSKTDQQADSQEAWSGDGLVAIDGHGRLTFVTRAAAELLGRAPRELVGRYVHDAMHASGEGGLWHPVGGCELEAHVTDGRPHHVGREVFYRPDGSRFPAEYVTTPMYEEDRLMGTVLIFKDLSRQAPTDALSQDEFVQVPDVDEAWATRTSTGGT